MEKRRKFAQMRVNEFKKWFDFFPLRTSLYRFFGFVPLDVPKFFEFGEMGVIK